MKTSLNLEDSLVKAAQKEIQKTGKSLSDTISHWARVGRDHLAKKKRASSPKKLKTVNLGGPSRVDLSSRRDWKDLLDR